MHTGDSPEVGQKQKTEKKKKEREKERKLVITMAKLRMAHASRLGQYINICEGWAYIICSLLYSSVAAYLTCNTVNIKKDIGRLKQTGTIL